MYRSYKKQLLIEKTTLEYLLVLYEFTNVLKVRTFGTTAVVYLPLFYDLIIFYFVLGGTIRNLSHPFFASLRNVSTKSSFVLVVFDDFLDDDDLLNFYFACVSSASFCHIYIYISLLKTKKFSVFIVIKCIN